MAIINGQRVSITAHTRRLPRKQADPILQELLAADLLDVLWAERNVLAGWPDADRERVEQSF